MSLNPPRRSWLGARVWLVGASSGIGLATAAALHQRGAQVIVSARNAQALQQFVQEHPGTADGSRAQAIAMPLDATVPGALLDAAKQISAQGPLDLVLYCAGYYREQRATAFDLDDALKHEAVNYTGALRLLDAVLPVLLAQRSGHISLVSSVAGFGGLPKGLAYGPTKAALINLAETLYLDLGPQGIGVSVINPGFVDTPLTAQNGFAMPALIGPDEAAKQIIQGWERGAFEIHFPRRFTLGMKLLQCLPYRVYFALVRKGTGL